MTTPGIAAHTSSQFSAELDDMRQHVLTMGGLVEQQLELAVRALIESDADLALEVAASEQKVNDFETFIDDECARILARRQPTASDLRLVYAIIKTITDLERMGDESNKIARMAVSLAHQGLPGMETVAIQHLARHVIQMVHDALDALARMDADAALATARADQTVDREYEALLRQCITFMMEDPRSIRRVMDIIWSVRALERIGDHARNIAEYVIYYVKGRDVRHVSMDEMERAVKGR
ncbi:phosphate signaling complex protein PhoU [Sinimarinibacterium sp. NLF-5-8]|uniref:phosphate signaling complex protein PhoU n=1 Tax=Sinimarinibacterium sp. NLF-5-8 TaxID=2698684 RepID=UPI00137BEE51|nr:phosphate signaling complex protein PhoU [Sinimarinibacterium sp. NLF-5-8]QHS11240.1 phosphate signaling complex protein PhoU [Sinimarinibacterium sp. NLF-5-8]